MSAGKPDQSEYLTVLARVPAQTIKEFVEEMLPHVGEIRVLTNRSGLVMLPYMDSRKGIPFHLGEVLMTEARVSLGHNIEGYGACLGRDHEQALCLAILDGMICADLMIAQVMAFVDEQADTQRKQDHDLLCQVEATRVELETF